jgi:hypothetical protein
LILGLALCCRSAAGELLIPAFTAYLDPDPEGARVRVPDGVSRWQGPRLKVLWFGELDSTGRLDCAIGVILPTDRVSHLRLSVAGQSHEANVTGGEGEVRVNFGSFEIANPGYERFTLASLNAAGEPNGDVKTLVLDGPVAEKAHFNMKSRRNAASVHLVYPVAKEMRVDTFYCEVTALEDPIWTYYMACGWHRGYFGMQVNSPTERRIIFSVWDSGKEAIDRTKVAAEDRVTLVAKGEGVSSGDFGNEGTGGHSHWVYPWKTGEKQRFLVTAKPADATHTVYSGYYFRPEKGRWVLISSWRAPKEGGYLRGLYSFSEDFGGANGHLRRKALYGNQWIHTDKGQWIELTTATFSHDPTGRADRLDRFMGVEQGQFFLSQGGFVAGYTEFGERFDRPAAGTPPSDLFNSNRREYEPHPEPAQHP